MSCEVFVLEREFLVWKTAFCAEGMRNKVYFFKIYNFAVAILMELCLRIMMKWCLLQHNRVKDDVQVNRPKQCF